ncbi:exo-alpha-sialidase [Ruficoccus amylovorans]|uniref:Exo-alpha-sialidase n=1 Tax=Ruficoccus amylovorans TaxID=1804625 RepID=A0A842HAN1_9BACT|nr:sialidase family protein [Ruficoccus amylovorans]MBC2592644.1 exo-alpha-sialidase [Ruficoccus amylovorans]
MQKLRSLIPLGALLVCAASPALAQSPIRPMANDFVVVGESPDAEKIPLYSPSILSLPSGRLVAAYERGKEGRANKQDYTFILTSDDGGKTWTERKQTKITQGRVFAAGKSLYMLGHTGDLVVIKSDDDGVTWSDVTKLTDGQSWHQSACNVWYAHGNVYLVMERRVIKEGKCWPVGQLAPVLMRAKETDDLTKRESWTFASELPFYDTIPGYKENDMPINYFGVPFYKQEYPDRSRLGDGRSMSPMGWLEANVVQIMDPDHYWYDPQGRTFHLFMRAHTGGTGYAALAKVVENPDGTMTTSLEQVPSGKTMLFLPFPGGQMRFHVLYDEQTKLYWLLSSQATDSMRRVDRLPQSRYDLPNNERNRLALHFSKNMVDWCFAGLVATTDSDKEARHYASIDFDGDDLVILSRSGDENAKSAHDGNLITFHRVKNFRDLVY